MIDLKRCSGPCEAPTEVPGDFLQANLIISSEEASESSCSDFGRGK